MNSMTTTKPSYYQNVDDYLGPASRRFFGAGFKRSRQRIRHIDVANGQVSARAGVSYPADWSSKGDVDQLPHLSTVDVLTLGAALAEIELMHRWRLSAEQRNTMWLSSAKIQAGRAPLEDGLDDFEVSARGVASNADARTPGFAVSTVDSMVGPLRIRCDIEHPVVAPAPRGGHYPDDEDVLGEASGRLYGDRFKQTSVTVGHVTIDRTHDRSAAIASITDTSPGSSPGTGLEGSYASSVSIADVFAVGLQLGQILLYERDGVDRSDSNTLWMRKTVISCDTPVRPATGPLPVRTSLSDSKVLEVADEVWRAADVNTEMGGLRVRCAVAHRLP